MLFNAGTAGVKTIETSIDPLPNEENAKNNKLTRLVNVTIAQAKILYMEGEPRWEFKFLRRAVEDDRNLHLATILRTTQNKIYVQDAHGDAPKNIKDGFPTHVDDLFEFDGLIIGSSEAAYFTPTQQRSDSSISSTAAAAGCCSWAARIRWPTAATKNRF